jgi:hypothetical protein
MTDLASALEGFVQADITDWTGLPRDVTVADVARTFAVDTDDVGLGLAGDPPTGRRWLAADSEVYEGGLRFWLLGTQLVLVEGRNPIAPDGTPMEAPGLGTADEELDTVLGRLVLSGGERVYAGRGLAMRFNPSNGVLLGLAGFVPTTTTDYRGRLRPHLAPRQLLAPLAVEGVHR